MTKEEALDILNNIIADEVIGTYCIEIQKEIDCSKNCKDKDCYLIQAIEKVSNLIQKQDTVINKLKDVIDKTIDYIKDNYDKFDKIEIENNGIKGIRYIHKFNIEYLLNILSKERRGEYE